MKLEHINRVRDDFEQALLYQKSEFSSSNHFMRFFKMNSKEIQEDDIREAIISGKLLKHNSTFWSNYEYSFTGF